MINVQLTGILGKKRLEFQDNQELESYYEEKYRTGGYEGGFIVCGINVSQLNHEARHQSALAFLNPQPDEIILDAGCGNGSLSTRIAAHCRELHAIDIAGNALGPGRPDTGNFHFRKMNVENLGYEDDFFDQIVCVETLEHLLHPHAALEEFHRTLKPAGRLVITYPTINRTFIKRMQRKLHIGKRLEISEHLTEWGYDEIIDNVQAAGFELLDSEGIIFDFGVFGWVKYASGFLARTVTALSFKIRCFPRNSCVASLVFRKRGEIYGAAAVAREEPAVIPALAAPAQIATGFGSSS